MKFQTETALSGHNVSSEKRIHSEIVQISLTDSFDLNLLEAEWTRLQPLSDITYFLSWGWIGTWLSTLPVSIKPLLLTAKCKDETVGLTLLVQNTRSGKLLLFPSTVLLMNETGDPYYDHLTIEYNNLLVHRDYSSPVARAFFSYLVNQFIDWDEILINAADANSVLVRPVLMQEFHLHQNVIRELPSWYIDLSKIRDSGKDYLGYLNSNTRYQIRRAVRECEKTGPLQISIAESVEEAKEFLTSLSDLHQNYWNSKGQEGCFSNQYFLKFHKALIERRFSNKEIQLVRISLGEIVIGYLYNLISNEQVFFYQSGFNYKLTGKLKPGLVAHYMVIEHNLSNGKSIYNFMAGNERYKRSLSTDYDRLLWLSLQKNRMRFRIENSCITFHSSCKKLAKQAINHYKSHK